MSNNSVKLLATGSVSGFFSEFFDKLRSIDAKHGKFDFVLCVGDFFGAAKDEEIRRLLDGEIEPPVECYIMQGEIPLPEIVVQRFAKTGGELCRGLFLLSKSGMITTVHGLRIACLGGTYDSTIYSSADAPLGFLSSHFSTHTIERLLANTMSKDTSRSYTSHSEIQSSAATSQLVDILITHTWAQSITQFSVVPLPNLEFATPCAPLDEVIRRIRPRYHFASGGRQFWEREPFIWDDLGRVSRFISLGTFGTNPTDGKKQRWFYAFTIQPSNAASSSSKPPNATKNPFVDSQPSVKRSIASVEGDNYIFGDVQLPKRQRNASTSSIMPIGGKCRRCESIEHIAFNCPNRPVPHEGYVCRTCNQPGHFVRDCPVRDAVGDTGGRKPREGYMCRACGSDQHYIEDCHIPNEKSRQTERRGGNRKPPKEIAPEECWFCLSNPNLAKYLIVAIGTECYLTLPKGQIPPTHSSSQTSVPGGGHVLIVPIAHYPTYASIPSDLALPIVEETERYKSALHAFYGKHGAVMVTFEMGRLTTKGGHAHVQVVPVPYHLKDKIEESFVDEGRAIGIKFETDPDSALLSCQNGSGSYFRVDLPDGRKLVHLMEEHGKFNVQFGRQALVNLIGMPERLDWRACTLSEQEDQADAQAFKAAFAPFNPIE